MTKIQVGDPVPVVLQMVQSVSNLYPQAEIRDDAANLLTTLDMTHEASGLYVAATYNMPDEEFIKVTYIVYTDAGHTTESTSYLRGFDSFIKDESNTVVPDVAGTLATYDPPTNAEMVAAFTEIKGATWALGTDTLEHIRNKQTDIETDTNELQTNQGDWATATGFNTVVPDVAGTAATPADIASLNDISVADIIAGVSDGPLDLQEMVRIILAATAGKSSGGGTVTLVFRDAADAKARITATVDANGNRTAMTLDGS